MKTPDYCYRLVQIVQKHLTNQEKEHITLENEIWPRNVSVWPVLCRQNLSRADSPSLRDVGSLWVDRGGRTLSGSGAVNGAPPGGWENVPVPWAQSSAILECLPEEAVLMPELPGSCHDHTST